MVGPLEEWFHVTFDNELIYIHIHAPGQNEIKDSIKWADIIRVCFKTGDFMSPDEIYIFVKDRPESYLIPTEADGGADLWGEIINRKLFDAELAIKAATAPEDSLFCWPEIERDS
jgi:hypothetical protein